jgi:outer membrane immunogenic protein
MRRQFLLAPIGAIALAGSAFAAEPLPPPPPPPVPIFTWTGIYIGGQAGYAWDQDRVSAFFPGPFLSAFPFFGTVSFTDNPQGFIGGGHVGYNLQINQWVLGVEGTVDGTTLRRNSFFATFANLQTHSPVQGSLGLRLGVAFDRVLIYARGGFAFAGIQNFYETAVPFFINEEISRSRSGWTVGGGIQYALTDNWSIRGEYRYSDFGHFIDFPFAVLVNPFGTLSVQHHLTQNQVQFGISYKFGAPPPPVVAKY